MSSSHEPIVAARFASLPFLPKRGSDGVRVEAAVVGISVLLGGDTSLLLGTSSELPASIVQQNTKRKSNCTSCSIM